MKTMKTFKNLSLENQKNEVIEWVKTHLENPDDIEIFKTFIKNISNESYKRGYNKGLVIGEENAKNEARIKADSLEILDSIEFLN